MTQRFFVSLGFPVRRALAAAAVALLMTACTAIVPRPPAVQNIFVLNTAFPPQASANPGHGSGPTIVVTPPRAAPGFDTPRFAYVPRSNEISYYANSRWAEAPPEMLEPLLIQALEATGEFHAVVKSSSPVPGDLRLDTEIIHLQQEFLAKPSRLRFTVRAQVLDLKQRRVLATRTFDVVEEAPGDNAYGGATAAEAAAGKVLRQVAALAAEQAAGEKQVRETSATQ